MMKAVTVDIWMVERRTGEGRWVVLCSPLLVVETAGRMCESGVLKTLWLAADY
jgi:hypothetical protein